MANVLKKKDYYWVWTIISLALIFGFGYVCPTFSTLTEMGVKCLGVFLGVILLTIVTDQTMWPALIGIFALMWHGFLTPTEAVSGWLGTPLVAQFIFITAVCGALSATGAPVVIAKKIMGIRFIQGKPLLFIFFYFTALSVICLITDSIAAIVIAFPLFEGIRDELGYDKNDMFCKVMILGSYLTSISGFILPFKGVHLAIIAVFTTTIQGYGIEFDGLCYLVSTFLAWLLFFIGYTLSIKFVFKCNIEPLKNFDPKKSSSFQNTDNKLNKEQKLLLGALGVGILYSISLMIIPASESAFYVKYSALNGVWIWILIFTVLLIIRRKDGSMLLNGQKILADNTMWGVVALMGCFTFLGTAISSDALGIKDWIASMITPLLGNVSWPVMVFLLVLICNVFTQFVNGNPVMFTMIAVAVPIVCQMAQTTGINVSAICGALIMSSMCAFLTNGAVIYAPLLLAREEITTKFIWTKGWYVVALYVVLATAAFVLGGYIF